MSIQEEDREGARVASFPKYNFPRFAWGDLPVANAGEPEFPICYHEDCSIELPEEFFGS